MEENYNYTEVQSEQYPPITMFEWMLILLVLTIPLLNIILLLMWALGSNNNPTKVNFARAALLWMIIGIIISALFITTIISTVSDLSNLINV